MKMNIGIGGALTMIAALTLGACTNLQSTPYYPNDGGAGSSNTHPGYGVVQSIEVVQQENAGGGSDIGLGTIAGALIGGVVGNQIGGGRGKTVATVAGVAGGAYVGHELEKKNRQQQTVDAYKITVRMDDGSYQALMQDTNSNFRVGDRVRYENGNLYRY
jgi:outer membrane lipoprotein SlyB